MTPVLRLRRRRLADVRAKLSAIAWRELPWRRSVIVLLTLPLWAAWMLFLLDITFGVLYVGGAAFLVLPFLVAAFPAVAAIRSAGNTPFRRYVLTTLWAVLSIPMTVGPFWAVGLVLRAFGR